jgi:hypothetical protein
MYRRLSDDGKTVNARHEKSDDGEKWTLWMDVIKEAEVVVHVIFLQTPCGLTMRWSGS